MFYQQICKRKNERTGIWFEAMTISYIFSCFFIEFLLATNLFKFINEITVYNVVDNFLKPCRRIKALGRWLVLV